MDTQASSCSRNLQCGCLAMVANPRHADRRSESAAALAVVLSILAISGCDVQKSPPPGTPLPPSPRVEELRPAVTAFCGDCHSAPDPSTFPRDAWYREVNQGFEFHYARPVAEQKQAPPMEAVVSWYREQAPEKLEFNYDTGTQSPVRFHELHVPFTGEISAKKFPAVAHVACLPQTFGGDILLCDMAVNEVRFLHTGDTVSAGRSLGQFHHPAHVEVGDLDANGRRDFLISELGSFLPEDHAQGKVVWVKDVDVGTTATDPVVLLQGVGRVADARMADFDSDGDIDIVVAVFGWRRTGSVLLLEQIDSVDGIPQFKQHVVDERHGAIHVPVIDLDGDGDLDFVGLISQEYEEIAAYLNRGDGRFERQVIYLAGNPAYGSSGIELTDMDGDGDQDVLYTNGDTLDADMIKPYHAVQWLENTGDFPFTCHQIGLLPAVCRAVAGDVDRDGDLDVIAGAWVSDSIAVPPPSPDKLLDTVVWFEQSESGFHKHTLRREARFGCMAVNVADVDGDDDLDIIAGSYVPGAVKQSAWLTVFRNDGHQLQR